MEEMPENAAPLIQKQGYHESCAACKIEHVRDSDEGIPFKLLILVWLITLAAGTSFLEFLIQLLLNSWVWPVSGLVGVWYGEKDWIFRWFSQADLWGLSRIELTGLIAALDGEIGWWLD